MEQISSHTLHQVHHSREVAASLVLFRAGVPWCLSPATRGAHGRKPWDPLVPVCHSVKVSDFYRFFFSGEALPHPQKWSKITLTRYIEQFLSVVSMIFGQKDNLHFVAKKNGWNLHKVGAEICSKRITAFKFLTYALIANLPFAHSICHIDELFLLCMVFEYRYFASVLEPIELTSVLSHSYNFILKSRGSGSVDWCLPDLEFLWPEKCYLQD